ncbi:MAG: hypothetical protein GX585_06030, partial [Clostridiales bacterium]|nr:hypothetical protein [Clostridiales bacterium]
TVTHWARLSHVVDSIVTPEAGTDYQAVSAGMADLSDSLSVTLTPYAQQAKLEFENTHASQAVYVLRMKLRGVPLIGYGDDKKEFVSELAALPGQKELVISGNAFLQTHRQAVMAGTRLRDLLQQPRRLVGFEGPLCPWLELGDRVTLPNAIEALVVSLSISSAPTVMNMRLVLLPVDGLFPYTSYFTWGASSYADADSGRAYY